MRRSRKQKKDAAYWVDYILESILYGGIAVSSWIVLYWRIVPDIANSIASFFIH